MRYTCTMQHNSHHHEPTQRGSKREYLKFIATIASVLILGWGHAVVVGIQTEQLMASVMGVFFVVFGVFKLLSLPEFAAGFQGYDVIAKRVLVYGYAYPFLQLGFGVLYLAGMRSGWLDGIVIAISLISAYGVIRALLLKTNIHCVCLGTVIKLPLSTISFVEDFGMAAMAAGMLLSR